MGRNSSRQCHALTESKYHLSQKLINQAKERPIMKLNINILLAVSVLATAGFQSARAEITSDQAFGTLANQWERERNSTVNTLIRSFVQDAPRSELEAGLLRLMQLDVRLASTEDRILYVSRFRGDSTAEGQLADIVRIYLGDRFLASTTAGFFEGRTFLILSRPY